MRRTCTFFGHHDCPDSVKPKLRDAIMRMIEERSVECFYVGNQGAFDAMVRSLLKEMSAKYPHIRYSVVLAYMPGKKNMHEDHSDTILPAAS